MAGAKRHHYVPQFYLRRFADGKGQLRVYRSHSELPAIKTTVKDAAVRSGFYKLDLKRPGDPLQLEAQLASLESAASAAIARIVSARSWPLNAADRQVIATYMALQLVRTPEKRWEQEETTDHLEKIFYEGMTEALARTRLTEIGDEPSDDRVKLVMNIAKHPERYRFVNPPNDFLTMMIRGSLHVARVLMKRSWWLGTSTGPAFVTGDHIPVLFTRPEKQRPFMGIGLQDAEEVQFPLDRHHVLLMFPPEMPDSTIFLTRENVKFTNWLISSSSHRFVFSHPDDPSIDYMIPKNPRPMFMINEEPVYEADIRDRIRLEPIFLPFSVRAAPDSEPPPGDSED